MRRHFSLILYHLLRSLTYDDMMQLKNPVANILHLKSTQASEKMSINKITVRKLDTKECYVKKLITTSERFAYLLKIMQLILDILPT